MEVSLVSSFALRLTLGLITRLRFGFKTKNRFVGKLDLVLRSISGLRFWLRLRPDLNFRDFIQSDSQKHGATSFKTTSSNFRTKKQS